MIQEDNVYLAMRSLYRYAELKKMNSPEVITDNEQTILIKRFSALTPEEILYLATNFNSYSAKTRTKDAVSDEQWAQEIDRLVKTVN